MYTTITDPVKIDVPVCTLGEGPLWHAETGEFVFTDIDEHFLYAWKPEKEKARVLLKADEPLGAFLFDREGNLVLFAPSGVYTCVYGADWKDRNLLYETDMVPGERFNDAICDPYGRMIAGTKLEECKDGSLYLYEAGKKPRRIMKGLGISNGMGFSADGTIFYHTDSGLHSIFRYRYDLSSGSIYTDERPLSAVSDPLPDGPFGEIVWKDEDPDGAVPDGMTIDENDRIWAAFWGRGCVCVIDPVNKALIQKIPVDACQSSSLTFGGTGLDQVLVTTAATGSDCPTDGSIWRFTSSVKGREEFRSRISNQT